MVSKRWSVVLAGALLSMSVAACGTPGEPGAPADQGTQGAGDGVRRPRQGRPRVLEVGSARYLR